MISAAVWAGAAVVTGALPAAGRVRSLRRRATVLTWLVVAGLVTLTMVLLGVASTPASGATSSVRAALIAAPAGVAALTSVPLLGGLRAATRAFTPAPGSPTPPVLRASSAHPLLAVPVQLAALAAVLGALLSVDLAGASHSPATLVTLVAVAGLAVALVNAVRYGRLRMRTHRRRSADARPPHFGRYTTSVEVELSILRAGDERVPFVGGEDERRPARVLRVAHRDRAADEGDLDAVVTVGSAA
jgi:hypothetical protein